MDKIIPRDYQACIPDMVFDYLIHNEGKHPLIAIPTAGGKTIILALIIQKLLEKWPNVKIMVISHVKEIVKQDYDTLVKFIEPDSVGINSSGLGRREVKPVTIANIQSVYRKPELFNDYQFIIIDEAHLIPNTGTGMYRSFLGALDASYCGLTATPFRLGTGYIYGDDDETLFDDLIYDLTSMDHFNKLVEDGWLSKLKTKGTHTEYDTTELQLRGGEFIEKEMSERFDRDYITEKAVSELVKAGEDYKKWLVFAIDTDHAEHIAECLIRNGVPSYIVHSKMEDDRDRILRKYKQGTFRAIVNVNVLTTGFDAPDIDLICLLRPTNSPVLHIQMIGRGLRISEGKDHCLVMDFAGNTARLGPINNVKIRKKAKRNTGPGEPITKRCPHCDMIYHPMIKVCEECGYEFPFIQKITVNADDCDIVQSDIKAWAEVDSVTYERHKGRNKPDSVLVKYHCGLRYFKEWVCLDHRGYAAHKAKYWTQFRLESTGYTGDMPSNTDELLEVTDELRIPSEIQIDNSGKYPVICNYRFI